MAASTAAPAVSLPEAPTLNALLAKDKNDEVAAATFREGHLAQVCTALVAIAKRARAVRALKIKPSLRSSQDVRALQHATRMCTALTEKGSFVHADMCRVLTTAYIGESQSAVLGGISCGDDSLFGHNDASGAQLIRKAPVLRLGPRDCAIVVEGAIRARTRDPWTAGVDGLDADDTHDEITQLISGGGSAPQFTRTQLRAAFRKLDVDNSGALDACELHDAFLASGILCGDLTEDDCSSLVSCMDKDSSGDVDFDEFVALLHDNSATATTAAVPSTTATAARPISPARRAFKRAVNTVAAANRWRLAAGERFAVSGGRTSPLSSMPKSPPKVAPEASTLRAPASRPAYDCICKPGTSIGGASMQRAAPARNAPVLLTCASPGGATVAVLREVDYVRVLSDGADGLLRKKLVIIAGLMRDLEEKSEDASGDFHGDGDDDSSTTFIRSPLLDTSMPSSLEASVGPFRMSELRSIAYAAYFRTCEVGMTVMAQGDAASALFIVVSGSLCCIYDPPALPSDEWSPTSSSRMLGNGADKVRAERRNSFRLAVLHPGDAVGTEAAVAASTMRGDVRFLSDRTPVRYGLTAMANTDPHTCVMVVPTEALARVASAPRLREFVDALHVHTRGLRQSAGRRSSTCDDATTSLRKHL